MVSIEDIASSRSRLTIASLISSRPRTLTELAEATGMSIQGVLKQLKRLSDEGLLKQWEMKRGSYLRPRKLYFMKSSKVADYSQREMLLATVTEAAPLQGGRSGGTRPGRAAFQELEDLAEDVLILKRRVRELSRRTTRMVDEVVDTELRIGALIGGLDLTEEERQIAHLIFGDDPPERVRAILRDHFGCSNPEAAIKDVVDKIRGEPS